uniref:Down syndrome cell adhesion molecule-like protein Dscam2 n=2 Tax=Lutzomyia longipalpis TaxID=7200 RepID=A0A1B0GIB4_LUTLO
MPYIRPMSQISAVAGKTMNIKCPVAGYPIESIVWEKDNTRLPINMTTDQGTYSCIARNKHNYTSQRTVNIAVLVPPRISPFSFENDIMEGMRTQLMCSSSQGDQPLNITWFKGNRSIKTGLDDRSADEKSIDINEYSPFSSILTIHNVTSSHNGNYTCEISNRAATVSYTAVLSVSVPPRWIVEPQDQSVILGNLVIIDCKADGFPKPTVSWKQAIGDQSGEYRELSFATSFGIETHPNGSLIIPKVSKDHESNFLCQATNGIGAGLSKLIRLNVHVGPQVTVRNKLLSVRRGEKVTLICEAEGDEPLDISWRFKSHRIDPSYDVRYHIKSIKINQGLSSELTIIQTTLSDRGQYSCFASNAYGQHHSVIQLQVQEPPNFPRNLQINELASRTLILAWNPGDQDSLESQPVSNFVVQYKEAQDVWHSGNPQKVVPGDKTVALIGSLKPATNYHFRVYAENHLGTSAASDILTVQTDGEAPSGPPLQVTVEPLGRQQLIVTWRPPEHDLWNGELLGYTIGYRPTDSPDKTYNYTRVGIPGGEMINDFRLTGLEKYTQYSITVQAFNSKGDGPSSEPIVARTIEDVPSAPPQAVQCVALTAQSLQVSWQPPPKDHTHGIIRGYKIFYENDITRETKITSALNTVLHGLLPFTNYSVQVLAFTRTGEGVASSMVMCTTHQGSPDAPELIKAVVKNESSVIISWLPPRRSNGIITKYTIYIRILNKGQEIRILKDTLVSQYHYYEAKNLNNRETYEAWVTASTSIGEGPSTSVVKLTPNAIAPAAIISFGQTLSVAWKVDVKLPCLFVGSPLPSTEWRVDGQRLQKGQRLEVNSENSLILRSIQRTHEGNYTCHVRNNLGSDHIIFQLLVLVPPAPPQLSATASTTTSVSLQWHVGDNGGAPIRGFLLSFRQEFGDWEEIPLDRRSDSFIVEKLQCGTGYQFTLVAFNKIGNGNPSDIGSTRTKGNKPISPRKQHLIRVNSTTITLELSAWQDGGCPISHFAVEYRRRGHHLSREWILASSNVPPQMRYTIADLEPSLSYDLRVTAHNNAGTTVSEYSFETLSITGTVLSTSSDEIMESNEHYEFMDGHLIAIAIISIFAALIVVIGVVYCLKSNPRGLFGNNSDLQHPPDGKYMISEQRDQPYSTVRKSITQSPCRDSAVLDRIPEYSEDIYPYATFHLPDQENMSGNPDRPSSGCGASKCVRSTNTAGRRGKKPFKSESEEYDSLGSDTDTGSGEHGSRTESSNQLDDPINFCGRSYSPASKAGKEKFALFAKPSRHNGIHQFNNPEQNTSIERSPISKRTPQLLPLSQAYSAAAYCPTKDFNTLFTQYGHTRTSSYTEEGIFQHHYYNPQKLLSVKSIKSHSGVLESEFLTLTPKRRDRLLEQWQLDFRVMRNSSLDGIFNGATLSMDDAVNQFKAPNDTVKVPNINTTITDKTHIVAVDTPTKRQARHQQDYTIIV